jgi:hypothetical protein
MEVDDIDHQWFTRHVVTLMAHLVDEPYQFSQRKYGNNQLALSHPTFRGLRQAAVIWMDAHMKHDVRVAARTAIEGTQFLRDHHVRKPFDIVWRLTSRRVHLGRAWDLAELIEMPVRFMDDLGVHEARVWRMRANWLTESARVIRGGEGAPLYFPHGREEDIWVEDAHRTLAVIAGESDVK